MARVLVIEDEQQLRNLLLRALTEAGHEVIIARHGREGITLYETQPTDLVITDLVMPEQEGLETIKTLRRKFPRVKIIAMSGAMQKLNLDLLYIAEQFGAVRTLEKPFELGKFLDLVQEVLQLNN
jgi:DNA-binding NtrC family response regulator